MLVKLLKWKRKHYFSSVCTTDKKVPQDWIMWREQKYFPQQQKYFSPEQKYFPRWGLKHCRWCSTRMSWRDRGCRHEMAFKLLRWTLDGSGKDFKDEDDGDNDCKMEKGAIVDQLSRLQCAKLCSTASPRVSLTSLPSASSFLSRWSSSSPTSSFLLSMSSSSSSWP